MNDLYSSQNRRGKSILSDRMKSVLEASGAIKTVVIKNGLKHETYSLQGRKYLFVSKAKETTA